jgi:glucosylceramidase
MTGIRPALGLCLVGLAMSSTASANPRQWSLYETARDTDHRLAAVPVPQARGASEAFVIDPAQVRQEIIGFGGALTESSAWVLAQLPRERREEVLHRYFDPGEGLGYTLARTHINSCDFSLRSWALDETAGDVELRDFSLAPMRQWVLPLIHDARRVAGGDRLRILASPWSPPAWMKTNGEMAHGGSLRPEYRDAWARYFVRFVESMEREEGIPTWGLTVQNEPEAVQVWESCIYSPAEEAAFVRDHLGPALVSAGRGGVRLIGHDHNRDIIEAHADALLGDPACAKFMWGVGVHWYVSDDYAASARVVAKYPGKHVLFTEGCWEGGAKIGRWDRGERYATSIIHDLRNSVCGWIDWNIALDERGGPNHVGNFCDAPVIADLKSGTVHYQTSFHYIGHFSRHVPPGSHVVASSGGPAGLDSIAFVRPDGALVFVVMNKSETPVDFALQAGGERLESAIPAHAIHTYVGVAG